ncbi:MAG TPA: exonuclease domain-containing protein [Streptosporangiaceae bacterium]|nr:exonuclease domain-containing protein [Streptosporangiaceae bacterium]
MTRSVGAPAYRDSVIIRNWAAAARTRAGRPWRRGIQRRRFDVVEFAIVDVETTGWSPDEAGITEIGAVRMRGGQVREEFSSLVNPGRAIPADIVELTGISDAMVALAPPVGEVLPGFLDFARGCVLTAHNAPFDVSFLAAACAGCGLRWPASPVLDTVALARRLLGEDEVPNCKLDTLAGFFGAPAVPRHRALADAHATAAVLAGLLARLTASGVRTLAELSAAENVAAESIAAETGTAVIEGCNSSAPWQRYATPKGWGKPPEEATSDHRDRSGEGRCGADPGDRGDHRPDPAGDRGLLGDRRIRPGSAGPGPGA